MSLNPVPNFLAGLRLSGSLMAQINSGSAASLPLALVAYTRRTSQGNLSNPTEAGYLRLDNITMYQGRGYLFWAPSVVMTTTANGDAAGVRFRVNETGTATITSTQVAHGRQLMPTTNGNGATIQPVMGYYSPTADTTTASVIETLTREVTGSGSTGVRIFASTTDPHDFFVFDTGLVVPDTGVSL